MVRNGSCLTRCIVRIGRLDQTPFVLDNPDLLLVELLLEPVFLRLPEAQIATGVANLIDPMLLGVELTRRTQPGPFRLSLPRPAAKFANHPSVKSPVKLLVDGPAQVVSLWKQDLSDEGQMGLRSLA